MREYLYTFLASGVWCLGFGMCFCVLAPKRAAKLCAPHLSHTWAQITCVGVCVGVCVHDTNKGFFIASFFVLPAAQTVDSAQQRTPYKMQIFVLRKRSLSDGANWAFGRQKQMLNG